MGRVWTFNSGMTHCTQNKTNSENRHPGLSILKRNKKTTESVIFRLYFKDIVKPMGFIDSVVFLFFLNIENPRCPFSEFVLFCIFEAVCLRWFLVHKIIGVSFVFYVVT